MPESIGRRLPLLTTARRRCAIYLRAVGAPLAAQEARVGERQSTSIIGILHRSERSWPGNRRRNLQPPNVPRPEGRAPRRRRHLRKARRDLPRRAAPILAIWRKWPAHCHLSRLLSSTRRTRNWRWMSSTPRSRTHRSYAGCSSKGRSRGVRCNERPSAMRRKPTTRNRWSLPAKA